MLQTTDGIQEIECVFNKMCDKLKIMSDKNYAKIEPKFENMKDLMLYLETFNEASIKDIKTLVKLYKRVEGPQKEAFKELGMFLLMKRYKCLKAQNEYKEMCSKMEAMYVESGLV